MTIQFDVRGALRRGLRGLLAFALDDRGLEDDGGKSFVSSPSHRTNPDKYGDYIATSNSVFSCLTGRADLLQSLPLKAYRFTDPNMRTHPNIRRMRAGVVYQQLMTTPQPYHRGLLATAGLEELPGSDIVNLLSRVNPFWTFSRLLKVTEMSLGLFGRSFWILNRGQSGLERPQEIWWVNSQLVTPVIHPRKYISHFEVGIPGTNETLPFRKGEVIWFNYADPRDEFASLSPLAAARVYADYETQSMRANAKLHEQGMNRPSIVIPPKDLTWSPEQAGEIEDFINERFQGVNRAHRMAVFRKAVQIAQFGVTPKDAEFLAGINLSLEAVCRAYKWPIDLVGGRRTYNNLHEARQAAWTQAVIPEANFLASELGEQLVPLFLNDADVIWFDSSDVMELQEHETEKWTRQKEKIEAGVITINQYREQEGLDPLPWGDVWWQAGKLPVNSDQAPMGPTTPGGDVINADSVQALGLSDSDVEQALEDAYNEIALLGPGVPIRYIINKHLRHKARQGEPFVPKGAGAVSFEQLPTGKTIGDTAQEALDDYEDSFVEAGFPNLLGAGVDHET